MEKESTYLTFGEIESVRQAVMLKAREFVLCIQSINYSDLN